MAVNRMTMTWGRGASALTGAAAILALGAVSPSVAGPLAAKPGPANVESAVIKAQVGIYVGVGPRRHHHGGYYRPYRPYPRYHGGYYRPYYYAAPPAVTYYETRPYVARPARSYDPDAAARCASRFRSFNVDTGTYLDHDGEERVCPYLR